MVPRSAHVVPRDQDKFVFYVNNYIDWDYFNQLYDPDCMEKSIQNADAVVLKLRLASTNATNHRLEVAKEEQHKREGIMEIRKIEAMATKCCRNRGRISLSSREERNYVNDTGDNTDPEQANDKYPLQL